METMLRAALVEWLRTDATLAGLLNAVAEEAPTRASPPWLGLAETSRRGHESGLALAGLLKEMLAEGGEDPASARLHYALFHLLDRAGDAEGAWAALERGMRHQRAVLSGYHDPAADEQYEPRSLRPRRPRRRSRGTRRGTSRHPQHGAEPSGVQPVSTRRRRRIGWWPGRATGFGNGFKPLR